MTASRFHGPHRLARILNRVVEALPEDADALQPERLIAQATAVRGHRPPPEGRYLRPLQVLTASAASAPLNALGRRALAGALVLRLANHFAIEDHLTRHPEVFDEPIERPVFIVALPRTGTTMLHRLLASMPGHRALHTWEMDGPVGAGGGLLPPRAQSRLRVALLHRLCPDLRAIHDVRADAPEECVNLLANDLTSMVFTLFYDLPGYADFLTEVDLESAYRSHRRQLQILQAGRPRARWILKAPFHLHGLDALLRVYPDAVIVQTHRDPTSVVASTASLYLSFRRAFHTRVDAHALGRERVDELYQWLARGMAARAGRDPDTFVDVPYRALLDDPIREVAYLADRLGEPFDARARAAVVAHRATHRQHQHGRHRYDLATFGLDEAAVRMRFSAYTHWFRAAA